MTAPHASVPADRPAPWDPVVEWDAIRSGLVGLRDVLDQLAALEDGT